MNFNRESFCPEVWNQLMIDPDGDFRVCCLAVQGDDLGMAVGDDNQIMNVLTHDFAQAINSRTHKEHRLELAQNIKVARCKNCYDAEDSFKRGVNIGLKRLRVLEETAPGIAEYVTAETAHEVTNSDGSISDPKIVNLDLRFGNLCNLKCIMCNPTYSNQWYDDWLAISPEMYPDGSEASGVRKGKYGFRAIIPEQSSRQRREQSNQWWETDIWWQKFERIAPDLRYIYFTGGEPLLVPAHGRTLDILIQRGLAGDITLRYDTNLTVINQKIIERWQHFKDIKLYVSIDETQDRYHLIRFPGDFSRIVDNLKILKDNNVQVSAITCCVGMASVYVMPRIIALGQEHGLPVTFRYLTGVWDIRNLPRSAKLEIIKKYMPYIVDSDRYYWIQSQIEHLKNSIDQEDQSTIQRFVNIMHILDQQRGTCWKETIPDVYQLIKDHCLKVQV